MPTKLGQNFLKDNSVIQKIIQSANLQKTDFVLEIGPGKGILTTELAKYARKVMAIEIDQLLIPYLETISQKNPNIKIIHDDILKINLPEVLRENILPKESYKVIANIPYYITSKIIRLFLEQKNPPQEMILMVQKEVAERITAKPGDMSLLSVSVQYYADPEILFIVKKESFDPIPEVDSAVIRIQIKKGTAIKDDDFFRIVRAGFCARRKTLANNLSSSLHLDKKIIEDTLQSIEINPLIRAQELSIADWKKLSQKLN